ncbi:HTR-like protein, partial [Halobacteriales archaeon QS_8_65_32]
ARSDPELFELHYGDLAPAADLPEAIHYLSFTANETRLRREIGLVIGEEIATAGLNSVSFHDLSAEHFGAEPGSRRVVH